MMGAHGGSKSISLVTSHRASISLVHFDRSLAVAQLPCVGIAASKLHFDLVEMFSKLYFLLLVND